MRAVREAIERAVGQDGIIEERHPLVDRAIAGDHGGGALIPLDEDVVEVARLLGGELSQAEIIEDDDVGGQPAAQFALEGIIGAGLEQGLQELGDLAVADAVAGAAGAVAERLGEEALSHPDRAAEDDGLVLGEPLLVEGVAHAGAVVAHRRVPDDLLEADELIEAGGDQPQGQAVTVPPVDLVLQEQLEKLERAELGLPSMGEPRSEERRVGKEWGGRGGWGSW